MHPRFRPNVRNMLPMLAAVALAACGPVDQAASPESAIVPIPAFATPHGPSGGAATYAAAEAFLDTLSTAEKATVVLPIDSPLRRNWSNLPPGVTSMERNGLRLGDLEPAQLAALFGFLAAGLGQHGYETLADIVTAEAVLAESFFASFTGWSAGNYWLAFYGEPTPNGDWGWQFGGHHLAFNASLSSGEIVSFSPAFVGIEPAHFDFGGATYAPFADELADAQALVAALPDKLRTETLIEDRPRDIHAGPGEDGVIPPVEGSVVGSWPEEARGMLLDVVSHWLRLQPEEAATVRLAAIEAELDDTRFAWLEPTDTEGEVYYRIQGPTLIIEFSSDGEDVDEGGHYHSIYRDPTNEYGGALSG